MADARPRLAHFAGGGVMSYMLRRIQLSLALLVLSGAAAQDAAPPSEPLDWVESLAGRFQAIRNPVIGSFASGQLASVVCPIDRRLGSAIYRQALQRAVNLPDSAFDGMDGPVLPAYTFGALWTSLMPAAALCDPSLSAVASNGDIQKHLDVDRQLANTRLGRSLELIAEDPGRAAQLAKDIATSGIDPELIDMSVMEQLLAQLRTQSPDLAQNLFRRVLRSMTTEHNPSPTQLMSLGRYLFVPTQFWLLPDDNVSTQLVALVGTPAIAIADFTRIRQTADLSDVSAYTSVVLTAMKVEGTSRSNVVASWAIADQMLDKAAVLRPELVEPLKTALAQLPATDLLAEEGFLKGFLRNQRAVPVPPESEKTPGSRNSYQAVSRFLEALEARRMEDTRQLLAKVDEEGTRTQLSALLDFTLGTIAIEHKDLQTAFGIANSLQPGIKRGLLYAGIVAAGDRDLGEQAYSLAVRDSQVAPPEQGVAILTALAGAKLGTDPEAVLAILGQVVAALNSQRRSADWSGNDFIVDGRKTYHVTLQVPGVSALTLSQLLEKTRALDFRRLESVVLQLRDEARMAAAFNAIAISRAVPRR